MFFSYHDHFAPPAINTKPFMKWMLIYHKLFMKNSDSKDLTKNLVNCRDIFVYNPKY